MKRPSPVNMLATDPTSGITFDKVLAHNAEIGMEVALCRVKMARSEKFSRY
jgi:hypothetical protein